MSARKWHLLIKCLEQFQPFGGLIHLLMVIQLQMSVKKQIVALKVSLSNLSNISHSSPIM